MHTFRRNTANEDGHWEVGYYEPKADSTGQWAEWNVVRAFQHEHDAAAYVSWLNGGEPPIGLLNQIYPDLQ
jgi:hypothetical protein